MKRAFFSFIFTLVFLSGALLTADSSWKGPVDIFTAQKIQSPVVAVDGSGGAVIFATVSDDSSLFYTKGAQFLRGIPKNVHSFVPLGTDPSLSAISVNSFGNAAAVWLECNPTRSNHFVRSALFMNGNWTNPTTISHFENFLVQNFTTPAIYLDSVNRAVAAWAGQSFVDFTFHIQEDQMTSHWQGVNPKSLAAEPETLHSSPDFLTSTVLSGSPSGKALVVWCEPVTDSLHASYYDGMSWTSRPSLSKDVCQTASLPFTAVEMNSEGNAIILWNDARGGLSAIHFSNGSYGPAQPVYTPSSVGATLAEAAIVLNDKGNAVALWIMQNGQNYELLASLYEKGKWSAPLTLDTSSYSLCFPSLGIDGNGTIHAVWQKTDSGGKGAIYHNIYNRSSWLKDPQLLSLPDLSTISPRLSINHLGSATLVWIVERGDKQTVQALYAGPQAPLSAQNFSGKKVKSSFLFQTDIINVLTWSPSSDSTVKAYHLYRRGNLIATIPAGSSLTYKDRGRKSGQKDFYQLVCVNDTGLHSEALLLSMP